MKAHLNRLIESLCATGEAIVKKLIPMFSKEEVVFDFVNRYVAGLNVQQAGLFLKYVHALMELALTLSNAKI